MWEQGDGLFRSAERKRPAPRSAESIYGATEGAGYLLRTRIRAAIELLDQLYQYGEAGSIRITELGKETFEEEEVPELPEEE